MQVAFIKSMFSAISSLVPSRMSLGTVIRRWFGHCCCDSWWTGKKTKEKKGKTNVRKIKVMFSRYDTPKTKIKSGKLRCGVCSAGVGVNLILCTSCKNSGHQIVLALRED